MSAIPDVEAAGDAPKIICLTPVKNEAWILETFLRCASVWADRIIVADQMSDDGSREIAARFGKVALVDNDCPAFNEPERVQLLLREARKIPGRKILVALDADEILVGDLSCLRGPEFNDLADGTRIAFDWVNVHPSRNKYWNSNPPMTWGFVDDGSPHSGARIHSGRVPEPEGSPLHVATGVRIFHLQYLDWERMRSKHRWYGCYERLQFPRRSGISIYRMYHHMDSVPDAQFRPVLESDLGDYRGIGIDPFDHRKEACYRWDREILRMIARHGAARFRDIDIWSVDWKELAGGDRAFGDPRSIPLILLDRYLKATQSIHKSFPVRILDKLLKVAFRPPRAPAEEAGS